MQVIPKKGSSNFTNEHLEYAAKAYLEEKVPLSHLAARLGCSHSGLRDAMFRKGYLKKEQLRKASEYNRIYAVNKDTFKTIETEEDAYWLGYMYADGYNNAIEGRFRLSQAENSKESIYKFKDYLKAEHPVKVRSYEDTNPTWQDTYSLTIHCPEISKNLTKYGCTQKKSLTLTFPNINDDLKSHFIRGYFDGDGSISTQGLFTILSTKEFLTSIQNIFHDKLGLNFTKLTRKRDTITNNYSLNYGGRKILIKLRDYIYKDSNVYLQRKKDKFDTVIDRLNEVVDKKALELQTRNQEMLNRVNQGESVTKVCKEFKITRSRFYQIRDSQVNNV